MPKYQPSLEERKLNLIQSMREDCCGMSGGGDAGMSVGGDGFEGSSDAAGPSAGYDPLLGKALKKIKKGKSKKK